MSHEGAHVPTSVVLEELFRDPPPDYVTIAWLIGSLHKRSGIPIDPNWVALLEDTPTLAVSWYDEFLTRNDLDDDLQKKMGADREAARAYESECKAWQAHYDRAIEYPASRIFVALKGGMLPAKGRLLPLSFSLVGKRPARRQLGPQCCRPFWEIFKMP